jgi:Raf kinase inhibitor-like YbhB/YbcL family protein
MNITSESYSEGSTIPSKYTCDGENISPVLKFGDIPMGTKSLALICEDPDAPGGLWIHWLAWNIDPSKAEVSEGEKDFGVFGTNSSSHQAYDGPCPPMSIGEHRYFFRLYALDTTIDLPPESKKSELLNAIQEHILDEAELMGRYSR